MRTDDRFRETRRRDDTTARRSWVGPGAPTVAPEIEAVVTRVMDCAFAVHRALGPGFRESIYAQALRLEMDLQQIKFESEKPIDVVYRQWRIPGQRVDLLVEGVVLVELKSVPRLRPIHKSQVLSYLKSMDLRIGLLINFKARLLKDGFRRVLN